MALDIRSTIVIAAILALIIGVSLRFVVRDYPAPLLPSLRLWMSGILLACLAPLVLLTVAQPTILRTELPVGS